MGHINTRPVTQFSFIINSKKVMATPIWNFQENEAIDTEKTELKTFKPVGKFFTDVQFLVKLFGIHIHPCLKESVYKPKGTSILEDKDVSVLNFFKYRLDSNTLRVIQLALPA
jgi:hypothetical protein